MLLQFYIQRSFVHLVAGNRCEPFKFQRKHLLMLEVAA